jgi:hypothetical protein
VVQEVARVGPSALNKNRHILRNGDADKPILVWTYVTNPLVTGQSGVEGLDHTERGLCGLQFETGPQHPGFRVVAHGRRSSEPSAKRNAAEFSAVFRLRKLTARTLPIQQHQSRQLKGANPRWWTTFPTQIKTKPCYRCLPTLPPPSPPPSPRLNPPPEWPIPPRLPKPWNPPPIGRFITIVRWTVGTRPNV